MIFLLNPVMKTLEKELNFKLSIACKPCEEQNNVIAKVALHEAPCKCKF